MLPLRITRRAPKRLRPYNPFHTSAIAPAVIGVRAEDPGRVWERRAPLTPSDVSKIVKEGRHQVLVAPSAKRSFPDALYQEAGATVTEDLASASIILGVKEVPIPDLLPPTPAVPKRTYCFFSHTHKGQAYNRPLLSAMLASKARFLDWELLTDDTGARTTAFGFMAGVAGGAEALSGLGIAALHRGVSTPFLHVPRPFVARSRADLDVHLRELGDSVATHGTPTDLGPVTFCLSGRGRVSQGVRSVLDATGCVEWLPSLDALQRLVRDPATPLNKLYACQLGIGDYIVHKDGKAFARNEYDDNPERFASVFKERVAPYATVFINGAFWSERSPRIMTDRDLEEVLGTLKGEQESRLKNRMLGVMDISCDFGGGLGFVKRATTICEPYYYIGPNGPCEASSDATQVNAIEILPSELPVDASASFSSAILPYVRVLADQADAFGGVHEETERALERATICANGQLRKPHQWLAETLAQPDSKGDAPPDKGVPPRKSVLLLGSGLVAGPAVDCLLARPDVTLTIATNDLPSAHSLLSHHRQHSGRFQALRLDIGDEASLHALVAKHDVVVSLLPAAVHARVASACVASRTHLVTASYISPAMRSFHDAAVEADVVLLNELGLDPGLDHMSAMALLSAAEAEGSKVESFVSFCGGLPALENSHGPLGYKFSWSPVGVLTAASNDAKFRLEGRDYAIPGAELLSKRFGEVPIFKGYDLEGIANRDSLSYIHTYGLPPDVPTILRGTLRYRGFSATVEGFKKLGLLSAAPWRDARASPNGWSELLGKAMAAQLGRSVEGNEVRESVRDMVGRRLDDAALCRTLEALGILPGAEQDDLPHLRPNADSSPLLELAALLGHRLRYLDGERDLVLLHHELGVVTPLGDAHVLTSSLEALGDPAGRPGGGGGGGRSAMAKTVGLPAALGALHVLDGGVAERGVIGPTGRGIWEPLLRQLEERGVKVKEAKSKGTGIRQALKSQMDSHFRAQARP